MEMRNCLDINAKLMIVAALLNTNATVVFTSRDQFFSRAVRNIVASIVPTKTTMKGTIRKS